LAERETKNLANGIGIKAVWRHPSPIAGCGWACLRMQLVKRSKVNYHVRVPDGCTKNPTQKGLGVSKIASTAELLAEKRATSSFATRT
jgi:hypothetical protein